MNILINGDFKFGNADSGAPACGGGSVGRVSSASSKNVFAPDCGSGEACFVSTKSINTEKAGIGN